MFKMIFDDEKALESLLYITNRCKIKDIYHILKIQFFADCKHLERNGRFITGDYYVAMKNGPVAGNAYNFLKVARGENVYIPESIIGKIKQAFTVNGYQVQPLREADTDYLSISDMKCLDESISENSGLSFKELNDKSHGDLWRNAGLNDEITFDYFVKYSQNSEQLREYLNG